MLKRIVVGSTIAAAGWAAFYTASRWYASWGADPAEAGRELPGDDLVPDAARVDTRGITIAARPSAVWPWLVQMGYGRAGWYSYDRLDMRGRSADEIHPEWQALAVGDVLPTDSGGGFVVRALDPERALVAFIDSDLVAEQRGGSAPETLDRGARPGGVGQGDGRHDADPLRRVLGVCARTARHGPDSTDRAGAARDRGRQQGSRAGRAVARFRGVRDDAAPDAGDP